MKHLHVKLLPNEIHEKKTFPAGLCYHTVMYNCMCIASARETK